MADSEAPPVAKACTICAKSKAKCDWPAASVRCQRCTRLNKECLPQDSIRKRKAPKIRRAAQIAQLEEKVNSLLSVVGTAQQPPVHISNGPALLTPSASTPSDETGSAANQHAAHSPIRPALKGLPLGLPSILTVSFASNDPGMLVEDPDAMLSIFQGRMAPQAPFVVIPTHMTAANLRRENPFLYMAVMMVASFENTATQLSLGKKGLEYLVERLILRGEKSLDLLQGLLIYLSWYHYCLPMNHQLNNLLALASSLFVNLGLKRVSEENEVNEAMAFTKMLQKPEVHEMQPKKLDADERRALLGCYYLSSCLTLSFSKMDPLRFTPYVRECSELIASEREYDTDVNLSSLMKLQYLVEKQRLSGLCESLDAHQSDTSRAPVPMLVRSCQVELDLFKKSLSSDQLIDPSLAMSYHSAEMHLFEVCFKMSPSFDYSNESLRFSDIIHCCFTATQMYFGFLLSVPAISYCELTIVNIGQMFHALGVLYKLSVFDISDWDVSKVRRTLDLSEVLNQISTCAEAAGDSFGPGEPDSPWFYCSRKFRSLQSWWVAKLTQEEDSIAASGTTQNAQFDDFQAMINVDFLDENFWR